MRLRLRLREAGRDLGTRAPSGTKGWRPASLSATLENEAIATVENEATQTDWMGDLGGGLGVDPAARRGRGSAAAGRSTVGYRAVDGRSCCGVGPAAEVRAQGCADVLHAVRGEGADDLVGAPGDAGDGDRRAGRLDRIDHLVPRQRPVGCGLSYRRPDPADRLVWEPGDAAQCDLWFPPKRIPLEDGSTALLPVLVMVAAHSRFITGRMIPTRRTEDLLLGSWELIQATWAGAAAVDLGQRAGHRSRRSPRGRGRVVRRGRWRRSWCSCRPTTRNRRAIVERRNGWFETSFMPGRTFASPADFNAQFGDWLQRANRAACARSRPARST